MPIPGSLSDYPPPRTERILSALVDGVLRTDPTLAALGVTILAPEGGPLDRPDRFPDEGQLPAIRLRPDYSIRGTWGFEDAHRFEFDLPIELVVAGTAYPDRERLRDAFLNAIFPQPWTDERRAEVESTLHLKDDLGIERVTITDCGSQHRALGSDRYATVDLARVRVVFVVET